MQGSKCFKNGHLDLQQGSISGSGLLEATAPWPLELAPRRHGRMEVPVFSRAGGEEADMT